MDVGDVSIWHSVEESQPQDTTRYRKPAKGTTKGVSVRISHQADLQSPPTPGTRVSERRGYRGRLWVNGMTSDQ